MLFWHANVILSWCTNVKVGMMHSKISFKNLFESTNHTVSVEPLSNVQTNNTKTTLSHSTGICNSNYNAWSSTRNPQCERGTRGILQRAIVMTLLYSSTPYKQKIEIRGCMHDHDTEIITRVAGGRGAPRRWHWRVPDAFVTLNKCVKANHTVFKM